MFDKVYLTLQMLRGDFSARFERDEAGATAVEYALLVALIALVMAVGAVVLGDALRDLFNDIGVRLGLTPIPPP